ncbi:TRAP transporter small permease [Variovorax sp. VNK109]|uniref:TRAP transporter small permease n=1 Tax=Variovorax sp. VNK109 TaxID=3400919 RepID=UPI003C0C9D13
MQTVTPRIDRWCEISLGVVSGSALFAMMCLTFVDVVGRYFFSMPLMGGVEVIEVLLVITIFAGLPLAALHQEHIEIDVLGTFIPPAVWGALGRIGNAVFAVALVLVAWLLLRRARQLHADGEATAMLHIPLDAVAWSMVVFTVISALLHLLRVVLPRDAADPAQAAVAAVDES